MSIYKLAAAGSGGVENAIAQLDIQFDGILTAVHASMAPDIDANDEFARLEVSFISTNTFGSNDSRGSIIVLQDQVTSSANGYANVGKVSSVGGLAIQMNAGERLWMHLSATATVVTNAEVHLYVEDGAGARPPRVRR